MRSPEDIEAPENLAGIFLQEPGGPFPGIRENALFNSFYVR